MLELLLLLFYFSSFLRADSSVDALQASKKRKFVYSFQDDVEDEKRGTVTTMASKGSLTLMALQLGTALYAKFKAETGETVEKNIHNYEIENFPVYYTMFWYVWDVRAVKELEGIFPSIKFKKKPLDWRPVSSISDYENMTRINADLIIKELLNIIMEQTGQKFSKIIWSDFKINGWPDGIAFSELSWSLKNILKIYRNLEQINFVSKKMLKKSAVELFDKKPLSRALNLHEKIIKRFREEIKDPKANVENYKFYPWPNCISQNPKFWDEKAVIEIEAILPNINFIFLHSKYYSAETYYLRNEVYKLLMNTVYARLKLKRFNVLNNSINILNWPEGVPRNQSYWNRIEILRILRSIPNMEFSWKTGSNNNPTNLNTEKSSTIAEDSPTAMEYQVEPVSDSFEASMFDFSSQLDSDFNIIFPEESSDCPMFISPSTVEEGEHSPDLLEILMELMSKVDVVYLAEDFGFLWSNCTVKGWPDEVGFEPFKWTSQDLAKIKESIQDIEFNIMDSVEMLDASETAESSSLFEKAASQFKNLNLPKPSCFAPLI